MQDEIELTKQFLGYQYYNIGYGRDGRIPRAMCRKPVQLYDTIMTLNQDKEYNTYIRLNADYKCSNPCSITDRDLHSAEIYLLDIDKKDNPSIDIKKVVREFLLDYNITNYLFVFTGHGYQLWIRCNPASDTAKFKQYAGWIRTFIESDTGLIVDFTPNPSRYARFPGTINYNPPSAQGKIIALESGKALKAEELIPPTERQCEDQPPPAEYNSSGELDFIRREEKRHEIARILCARNPPHNERVYLVGFLNYCGLCAEDIIGIIDKENSWNDYDRGMTEKQVNSVLRSKRRR